MTKTLKQIFFFSPPKSEYFFQQHWESEYFRNTNVIVNKEHPSVCMIKENTVITDDLNFKPLSSDFLSKQINKLNIKKARGYDGISPKILKLYMPCIVELQSSIIFSKAV
jgi:hypothetical protein